MAPPRPRPSWAEDGRQHRYQPIAGGARSKGEPAPPQAVGKRHHQRRGRPTPIAKGPLALRLQTGINQTQAVPLSAFTISRSGEGGVKSAPSRRGVAQPG